MALLLKNAHVVDPSVELDGVVDVLIDGDKIAEVGENLAVEGAEVRDLSGKYLVPGLVDMHVPACAPCPTPIPSPITEPSLSSSSPALPRPATAASIRRAP